jgi:hypothetical protein
LLNVNVNVNVKTTMPILIFHNYEILGNKVIVMIY